MYYYKIQYTIVNRSQFYFDNQCEISTIQTWECSRQVNKMICSHHEGDETEEEECPTGSRHHRMTITLDLT